MHGPVAPPFPALASRTFSRNLRHYQFAGLGLDAPWWAVPLLLAVLVAVMLALMELLV